MGLEEVFQLNEALEIGNSSFQIAGLSSSITAPECAFAGVGGAQNAMNSKRCDIIFGRPESGSAKVQSSDDEFVAAQGDPSRSQPPHSPGASTMGMKGAQLIAKVGQDLHRLISDQVTIEESQVGSQGAEVIGHKSVEGMKRFPPVKITESRGGRVVV